jgi:hypothetical protein
MVDRKQILLPLCVWSVQNNCLFNFVARKKYRLFPHIRGELEFSRESKKTTHDVGIVGPDQAFFWQPAYRAPRAVLPATQNWIRYN